MHIVNIILLIFLALVGAVLLFFLFLAITAAFHLIRRPPRALYQKRAAEADFCPLGQMPPRLIAMTVLLEDETFREHKAISWIMIRRAIRTNRRRGKIFTGGSTLTQQLVKNLYLHFEQSLLRKLVEVLLAIAFEWFFTKDTILELYLNIVYFGCGQYGITAASAYYFGKKPRELTVNQMFMLVRLLHAPTANNPLRNPDNYIIDRNRGVPLLLKKDETILSKGEAEAILSYPAERIDPELRKATDERERYAAIPMHNERFGPGAK